jgi:beta-N-acetylhexosaminidase
VDALQQAVIRLYGPQAGRQVTPYFLTSYSYQDLIKLLDGDEEAFQMQRDLRRANWVVFAMLDVTANNPTSQALHRFLAERPDLFQQKRLIVFAFNAPYFLDATNISKLTAYYALYSKGPSFIDVAARLLFRELRPQGASPVTIPGIGYDLFTATQPDPKQVISLQLDLPEAERPKGTATPEPLPTPEFNPGNIIPIRTGIILDHNGHPVPDGTQVMFITTINGEVSGLPQTVSTHDGIARTTVQVTGPGLLEIRAESEPAKVSQILRFDIPGDRVIAVTATPTETPTLTPTIFAPSTSLPTPSTSQIPYSQVRPYLSDWLVVMLLISGLSFASYKLTAYMGQVRWGVRSGFLALIGGLLAYSYLALELPGAKELMETSGAWGIVLVTLIGCLTGILTTWGWRALVMPKRPES